MKHHQLLPQQWRQDREKELLSVLPGHNKSVFITHVTSVLPSYLLSTILSYVMSFIPNDSLVSVTCVCNVYDTYFHKFQWYLLMSCEWYLLMSCHCYIPMLCHSPTLMSCQWYLVISIWSVVSVQLTLVWLTNDMSRPNLTHHHTTNEWHDTTEFDAPPHDQPMKVHDWVCQIFHHTNQW